MGQALGAGAMVFSDTLGLAGLAGKKKKKKKEGRKEGRGQPQTSTPGKRSNNRAAALQDDTYSDDLSDPDSGTDEEEQSVRGSMRV